MIFTSSLITNWEKLSQSTHTNLAIFMFLFMVCAFEVVLLKMTTSTISRMFDRGDDYMDDDSSEYEEDIYYENLHNNYDYWARRRMRQQRLQHQLLQQFRQQQQQQQQQHQQQQHLNLNPLLSH